MDSVWDGRSDGPKDEAGSWAGDRSRGRGIFLGRNVGRPTITNGEFAV